MTEFPNDRLFGLTDPLPTSGRHFGYVKIPYSSNSSAYGFIPVPLAIVGGAPGPTLLLLAGVFGDELAAQIAVTRVVAGLDAKTMRGRVVAMTMANQPAAVAGTRNSPIDGRNLAKSFPGDPFGTPTSIIADYIERHLMPAADLVIDLHSDGNSLSYLPSTTYMIHTDMQVTVRRIALAQAFGAPNVLGFEAYEERNTSGAARRAGAVRIATEFGGANAVPMMQEGVLRVLEWAGIARRSFAPVAEQRHLLTRREEDFVYALADGIFAPLHQPGDRVQAGDLAGHILDVSRPFAAPIPIPFAVGGTIVCTRGVRAAARAIA